MKERKNLQAFIEKLKIEKGINYTAFATSVGVSISQLSQIIHGKQDGTFLFWAAIADVYDLNIRQLLALYDKSYPFEDVYFE